MSPKELALLLRLRALRVQAAWRSCAEKREAVAAAETAIAQRQQRIDDWQRRRAALARQVVGPAAHQMGRFAPLIAARREFLDDQLERDEYGLIDDEDDRDTAQQALQGALAEWQRERAREDGVRDLLSQARGQLQRLEERRAELEAQERVVRGPVAMKGPR